MDKIDFSDFEKSDIRVGKIISAEVNEKALKPAYILKIDFGDELGTKTSSAQLTQNYTILDLIGRKICAVINFHSKRIAGVKSEVLVLGSVCQNGVLLLTPDDKATLGSKVS
jgi:tRNA-binding protein